MTTENKLEVEHKHHILGNGFLDRWSPASVARISRRRRGWLALMCLMGLVGVRVAAEGWAMVIPPMGSPLIPGVRWLTLAFPSAALLLLGTFVLWDQIIKRIKGVIPWKKDGESIFLAILATAVLLCDTGMFAMGLASWGWGGASLSPGVMLGTLCYVSVVVFLAWASVDGTKGVAAAMLALCLASTVGCEAPNVRFGEHDSDQVVTFLVDVSPSFIENIEQGSAFAFLTHAVDTMFRDTIGSRGRIIISKISGDDAVILLDTTPMGLRQRFSDPDEFKAWLLSHSGDGGSRVHEAMLRSIDYMRTDRNVSNGKAKSALIVLTDGASNGEATTEEDVVRAIRKYQQPTGLYFLIERNADKWRGLLAKSGVSYCVEAGPVEKPPVPRFR